MALHRLFGQNWWDMYDYPTRIMDQCFAIPLLQEDLLAPRSYRGFCLQPRSQVNISASGKSEVKNDNQAFQVALNVSQFKPEELTVKVIDNYVQVHGKHEEKSDEHGFVSREFTRRYMLPQSCESDTVTSSMTQDGILNIVAPKKALELPSAQERNVPIQQGETTMES